MKYAISLLVLAIAGCTADPLAGAPATDTAASAATTIGIVPIPVEATDSVVWNPRINTGDELWPTTLNIHSAQLLIKRAPVDPVTGGARFLAFVVWNGSFVGRIYQGTVGAVGNDLRLKASATFATRTSGLPDHNSSSTGNASSGPVTPLPHPNVDGTFHFSTTYLDNVRTNALAILNATADFEAFTE